MAIETFKSAKDWLLVGMLIYMASMDRDTNKMVQQLHDDNIVKTIEIKDLRDKIAVIDKERKNDREQDLKRLHRFEAILNDNHIYQKKMLTEDGE